MRVSSVSLLAVASAYDKTWFQTQYTYDSGKWADLGLEGGAQHGLGASHPDGSQMNEDGEAYLDYNTLLWIPDCVASDTCSKPKLPLFVFSQESFHTSEQTVLHFLGGGVAKPDGTSWAATDTNPDRDNVQTWVDEHEFIFAAPNARSGYFTAQNNTATYIWQSMMPLRYWHATPGCCGCTKGGFCADETTQWYEEGSEAEENYEMEETFFRDLVEQLDETYGLDRARMYFTGGGGGGFMPERAACSMSDLFAGSYINTGSGHPNADDCVPTEPIHILQNQYTGHTGVVPEGTCYGGFPRDSTAGPNFEDILEIPAIIEAGGLGGQECMLEWTTMNVESPPGWHLDDKDPSTPATTDGTSKIGVPVDGMSQTCVDQFVQLCYPSSIDLAARWATYNGCDAFDSIPDWDEVELGDGLMNIDMVANSDYDDSQWEMEATLGAPWAVFSAFSGGECTEYGCEGPKVPYYEGDDTIVFRAENCNEGGSVEFQWVLGDNTQGTNFNYVPWNWDEHSAYLLNWVEEHPKTIACAVDADCPTGYECENSDASRRARQLKFGMSTISGTCSATFDF